MIAAMPSSIPRTILAGRVCRCQRNCVDEYPQAALSASGTRFWIKDNVSTGTTYGTGAACTGTAALAAAGTSW